MELLLLHADVYIGLTHTLVCLGKLFGFRLFALVHILLPVHRKASSP